MTSSIPAVAMRNIVKTFPGIRANDDVSLTVAKGQIHALVGENGAGKTTLMNILYGLYQPDSGVIEIHGHSVHLTNPHVAIERGIGMVHQHFMLVDPLSVTENIVLGSEPTRGPFLDLAAARKSVVELSDKYGLAVDADAKIQDIVVGMQQRVEILKLLYRGADILIFDEPTAVLTPQETDELFVILKRLTAQGKTVIFITHKLREVLAVTDQVTVMRQGRNAGEIATRDADEHKIASMMVGRDVLLKVEKKPRKTGDVILQVTDLRANDDRGLPAVQGTTLQVRAGEILGIAGVAGNGQTELTEVLTGLRPSSGGRIHLHGQDVTHMTAQGRMKAGMAYVWGIGHIPEDRHKRGLVLRYSVADNLILGLHRNTPFSRMGVLDFKAIAENAAAKIEGFDIRTPSRDTQARALSGGNQQKIVIAREFSRDPQLLVVVQPTRGVDVGAIEFIHRRLVEKRDKGAAILLISMELEEIMALSDRIAVMYEGRIVGEMNADRATEQTLGVMMSGAHV